MGGSAFASLGLATPRMPMMVYRQVLNRTHTILKEHFREVGTPSKSYFSSRREICLQTTTDCLMHLPKLKAEGLEG